MANRHYKAPVGMNPNVFYEFIAWHKEHMSVLFNLGYYADPKILDTKVCKNSCHTKTIQRLVKARQEH